MIGKQLVFVTNNSTKSRASYKAKFDSMKIPVKVVSTAICMQDSTRLTQT